VLINPLEDRLKHIAGEIYLRAMTQQPQFAENLVKESAALEAAGYHAQVYTSADAVPLFMLDEGRRTALTRQPDGRFQLKSGRRSFAADELLSTVERCPNCFSPNVTLRPIVQDFLLPTLAYIGGPAEIAYFAQLRPNYALLGRVPPVVLTRASFSLIERRQVKTFEKYALSFRDLFNGQEETLTKIVEHGPDAGTVSVFEETEKLFEEQLERLRASLAAVDAPLADALKGGREKIFYQLHNLRTRFINNRAKRDETMHQQIEKLFALLYPNKGLQERELNFAYFLARYGAEVIDRIYAEVDVISTQHKLIPL
jgi:bacillithiol biosynthesis cysteine-adding enzyme BshC